MKQYLRTHLEARVERSCTPHRRQRKYRLQSCLPIRRSLWETHQQVKRQVRPLRLTSVTSNHVRDIDSFQNAQWLPHSKRLQACKSVGILLHQISEFEHIGGALSTGRFGPWPGGVSCLCGKDCSIDVFLAGNVDVGCDYGVIVRICDCEALWVDGINVL